jgi:hypothetical protein
MTNKITLLLLAVLVLTLTAVAQTDRLNAIYEQSATIPTNIEGIRAYPTPPSGFDPLAASDEELAAYGIPMRPDKVHEPAEFRQWTRLATLMSNPHARWYGELKPRGVHGSTAVARPSGDQKQGDVFGATGLQTKAWSGVVNTVPGTTWNSTKSFHWVTGEFNVPYPQQAFSGSGNICDGDTDQASLWVGLGGLTVIGVNLGNQNNIAQAGIDIFAYCGIGTAQGAYAWVEWYPGASVGLYSVNAADDIMVNVTNTSATSGSFVVADYTNQTVAGYTITAPSGYKLVGNEAEYIVERPGGDQNTPTGLYPLANYIWSFWDFTRSRSFTGIYYYPGNTNSSTYDVSMTDDSGSIVISVPSIDKGLQNLFVNNQDCSYAHGCTP